MVANFQKNDARYASVLSFVTALALVSIEEARNH